MKTGIDIGLSLGGRNPHRRGVAVTPSDTDILRFSSLYVTTGGDIAIGHEADPDTAVVYSNVADGTLLPVAGHRVFATGTDALGMFAFGASAPGPAIHVPPSQPGDPPINENNVLVVDFIKNEYVVKEDAVFIANESIAASPLVYAGDAKYVQRGGLLVLTDGVNVPLGDAGYLCEPAATNLMLHSNTFTDAAWTKVNSATVAHDVIGPDGVANSAATLTLPAGQAYMGQIGATLSDGVVSVYARKGDFDWFYMLAHPSTPDGATKSGFFDLANGNPPINEGVIEAVGNGWFKCSVPAAIDASTGFELRIGGDDGDHDQIPAVDGTIEIWNGQLETGPVATSPIITGAGTVTRAADGLTLATTEMPWWPIGVAGTAYAHVDSQSVFPSAQRVLESASNSLLLYWNNNTSSFTSFNGTEQLNNNQVTAFGVPMKMAVAFEGNVLATSMALGTPDVAATDVPLTTANFGTGTTLSIGRSSANTFHVLGHIKQVALAPRKFTNQELIDLTT